MDKPQLNYSKTGLYEKSFDAGNIFSFYCNQRLGTGEDWRQSWGDFCWFYPGIRKHFQSTNITTDDNLANAGYSISVKWHDHF